MGDPPQVLVVDDEPEVLKQIALFLADTFRVARAGSAAEAADAIDWAGPNLSVLVTDMRLGGGRHGGLDLARRVRERGLDTEVVFLTGYPQIEDASLCMQAGAFGYVEKARADTFDRLLELTHKAHRRWLDRREPPAARPRALVLDDYPEVAREVALFLGRWFDVATAGTLDEAFDLLARAGGGERFAVAVTDMQLQGDRRGGLRLAEELARRPDRPEVVFLTGHPQIEDASLCMQAGAFGYVEKAKPDTYRQLEDLCARAEQRWRQRVGLAPVGPKPVPAADPPGRRGAGGTTEIFVSYSHQDTRYREDFDSHMAALRKYGKITVWSDANIKPSEAWREEIEAALARARIGVALVSKNYIGSDFCTDVELRQFLAAQAEKGLRLIAIIVADCYWQGIPDISRFQVLPKDRNNNVKPIKSFKDKDAAWAAVVKAIADLLV